MDDARYLVAVASAGNIRPSLLRTIRERLGSWEEVWKASVEEFIAAGIPARGAHTIVEMRSSIDPDAVWGHAHAQNMYVVTEADETYPKLLRGTVDAPIALFCRGTLPAPDLPAIAVVGSRSMTPYGMQVTEMIVPSLARAGLLILSGLARGIDGEAHRATIATHGTTIAVVGSGIDHAVLYPREHRRLSDEIVASGGAVVSEYPPGTAPARHHFPARNRILAGWALGVLVIEARIQSGALITARFAADDGREVFAVPGPITSSTSAGPHALISAGAALASDAKIILDILGFPSEEKTVTPKLEGLEASLFNLLRTEPVHIDTLADTLSLDIATCAGTLTLMELRGIIKNIGGMRYIKLSSL